MRNFPTLFRLIALTLASALVAGPVLAKDGEGNGRGQGQAKQREKAEKRADKEHKRADKDRKQAAKRQVQDVPVGGYFSDQHRSHAREYYTQHYSNAKSCPPGLAKKNNGCMPPGQAKKWAVGEPLPHDVVYYNLPPRLVVQLGHPPAGYRYVRVATDILLIAIGTGMVVDAIQDLVNM